MVKMVGFKVKKGHESWERHFFDDHNIFPVFFGWIAILFIKGWPCKTGKT